MSLALYRKYRPQLFSEVIGQARITDTLQEALKRGQVGHAYLFAGPRGTGKTTVARLLARAVNCAELVKGTLKSGEPCNKCEACKRAQSGRELDLIEIDAASNRGIDEIRELRERVRFAPSGAGKKVFLIDEVHMLTKEAFNALLKTLEEPPAHAIFILATTELHSIPPTILSRVQQFGFRSLTIADLAQTLTSTAKAEKISLDSQAAELIATLAEGGARDALSLLDVVAAASQNKVTEQAVRSVLALPPQKQFEEWASALAANNVRAALDQLQQAYQAGTDILQLTRGLVRYMRLVLLAQIDPELVTRAAPYTTAEQRKIITDLGRSLPRAVSIRAVSALNQAALELRTSSIPLLPLEVATIQICSLMGGPQSAAAPSVPQPVTAPARRVVVQPTPVSKMADVKPMAAAPTVAAEMNADVEPVDDAFLQTLIAGWSDALASVRSKNVGVGSLLKSAVLLRVSKAKAWFVVDYTFHKDRIMSRENRHLVEVILEERFKRKLQLVCLTPTELTIADKKLYTERKQLAKSQSAQQAAQARGSSGAGSINASGELADLALNLLGGQVVE